MRFFKKIIFLLSTLVPDKLYLKMISYYYLWYWINLTNPKRYNEKLNWLKLNYRNPLYTKLVDKYEVKKYIEEKVGKEHVIPALWVRDKFDDIDFDRLPNQFVLKCTHNSWCIVIVKDKKKINKTDAKNKLEKWLKENYFWLCREWPYKNVKPRIIAEEYIDSLWKPESIEYKLTCFDWVAKLITLCRGVAHAWFDERFNDFYDRDLNPLDFYVRYKNSPKKIPIPKEINEIIDFCEKVSKDIPCVRIDVYLIDWKIYFWEMTFYTRWGYCVFTPKKWDDILWEWINLPKKKNFK